jgi:antitoxin component of MazEF toxin-antitoxin module
MYCKSLVLLCSLFLPLSTYARTWIDATGKFKIEADFVELTEDDQVRLKASNGKTIAIPLSKLSVADREHVASLMNPERDENPFATEPASGMIGTESAANMQTVEAEGVGLSPSAALKDAFREAVRQVVGTVVDGQTLVENDELIQDKVLTYSDGFVKKYEKLGERSADGLIRVKIRAEVEQRSLVMKLEAANISVKRMEGKSLFAETITQLDAEKNATALLKKAFGDLPALLTAENKDAPEYDRQSSEVVLNISVGVDEKAYQAFAERLGNLLKKIRLTEVNNSVPDLAGPKVERANQWCVWLCSFSGSNQTSTRWNAYTVDADMKECLSGLQMPSERKMPSLRKTYVTRHGGSKTVVVISMLDSKGQLVAEDEFELVADSDFTFRYNPDSQGNLPLLRHFAVRDISGQGLRSDSNDSLNGVDWDGFLTQFADRSTANFYIAPFAFTVRKTGYGNSLYYRSRQRYERRVKVALEDLKRITSVECKVAWRPGTR